jgi:hypothetical protein
MKQLVRAVAVAAVLAAGSMAGSASAQNATRNYDNGPVWEISYIETKPGMFDDYMQYVGGQWRALNEAQKKAGYVLDYDVLAVDHPRDHEPDLILIVKYKNMAAFDQPLSEGEALMAKTFGSMPAANQGMVARESVRVLRGTTLARELTFLK